MENTDEKFAAARERRRPIHAKSDVGRMNGLAGSTSAAASFARAHYDPSACVALARSSLGIVTLPP